MTEPVKVKGLAEFNRNLKQLDRDLPKAVRIAFNAAADVIVADAKGRVPHRRGRAKASVRARSTRTKARVTGGGARAPYYPWLDFGGRVGRRKATKRPVLADGRYIYNAYFRRKGEFRQVMEDALVDVVRQAGLG